MPDEIVEKTDENAQIPDRIAEIAQTKMAEITKSKEESAKAKETSEKKEEPKDASTDTSTEKEKIEEPEVKKEEAKEPVKEEKPETEVEKIKRKTQERIDEAIGKLKAEENARKKDSEKIAKLEKQITELQEVTKESEEDVYDRIIDEDKEKPINQRREMSEADLEEYLLDDYSKATQWIIKRDMRRERESAKVEEKPKEKVPEVDSTQELISKYPKINVTARAAELAKDGKSDAEITKIMREENKDFNLMMEIIESDPPKYADRATGPGLVLAEMNKRSTQESKPEVKTYTAEELDAAKKEAAEMERKRIESIDVGHSSNHGGPISASNTSDPNYQLGLKMYLKATKELGKTEKDYKDRLSAREKIPGVSNYKD